MQNRWQIELFYGHECGEYGIYHSFIAKDPDVQDDSAPGELAEMLGVDEDGEDFNWDSMYIELPATIVDKIKAEGVAEFLKTHKS